MTQTSSLAMARRFPPGLRALLAVVALLAVGPCLAGGQSQSIYRWIDAGGLVTYGNHPPRGVDAERLMEDKVTLSVYRPEPPPPPWIGHPASVGGLGQIDEQIVRERLAAELIADTERLERCLAEQRLDCDEFGAVSAGGVVLVPAVPPRGGHRPPGARSKFREQGPSGRMAQQKPHRQTQRALENPFRSSPRSWSGVINPR